MALLIHYVVVLVGIINSDCIEKTTHSYFILRNGVAMGLMPTLSAPFTNIITVVFEINLNVVQVSKSRLVAVLSTQ